MRFKKSNYLCGAYHIEVRRDFEGGYVDIIIKRYLRFVLDLQKFLAKISITIRDTVAIDACGYVIKTIGLYHTWFMARYSSVAYISVGFYVLLVLW